MENQTSKNVISNVSTPEEGPAPSPTKLQVELGAGLGAVEKMAAIQRAVDEQKVQRVRKSLQPFIQKARSIKDEFAAFLQDHAAELDRLVGLDINMLRTFRGYNLLGDLAEDAKRFREDITICMKQLDAAVSRAENFSVKDFGTSAPHDLSDLVGNYQHGPERAIDKLWAFKERLEKFTAAQHR